MKISIFSDCHCGYAYGEERENDSFLSLKESIEKSLDSDLILMAGDVFDSRIPKQEIFAKTAKILSLAQNLPSNTELIEIKNKEKHDVSPLALRGIPIVAIHGTHERRSKHMVNPIQSLEHAGLLIHLHCATAIFNVNGGKVAIHGLSGVPERYAKNVLDEWNPKPVENAINIFMFHQSLDEYIYSPLEPPSLKLKDLPKGFDLYILGHIHWHDKKNLNNGTFIVTGSTIPTTVHKIESEQEKGLFTYDGKNIEFIPLENQRKIFFEEFEYQNGIEKDIENKLEKILNHNYKKRPLITVKITGKLKKDEPVPNFNHLKKKFGEKAILKINQNLKTEELDKQIELLRLLREQKLSPEEQGLELLRKNLEQTKCAINIDEIFDLLTEGNIDLIYDLLTGKSEKK